MAGRGAAGTAWRPREGSNGAHPPTTRRLPQFCGHAYGGAAVDDGTADGVGQWIALALAVLRAGPQRGSDHVAAVRAESVQQLLRPQGC